MVGARPGLGTPVLDDLEVLGLVGRAGLGQGVSRGGEHRLDHRVADRVQRPMLLRGRDDRPPATGRARLGEGDLGEPAVELAGVVAGPDHVEREVLEHPHPDPAAVGCRAVRAPEHAVVDRLGGAGEAIAMEGAVDDRGDPPVGDGVTAKLEQPGGHLAQSPVSVAPSSAARARAKIGAASSTEAVVGGRIRPAQLGGDRGRADAGHPARVDQLEVGQVDRDVQSDPVVGDATLDAQAEGPDLARVVTIGIAPAARVAVAPAGRHPVRRTGRAEGGLQRPDERPDHQAAIGQRHDRIGHQLAWPVVGDLATALHADDLDGSVRERGLVGQDVAGVRVPTERQHGRMLEQEESVADATLGAFGDESLLQGKRLVVVDPPEP